MPTLMPYDTREVLGQNAEKCDSRSLLLDRFCDPTAKEKDRHQVFIRAMGKTAIKAKSAAWHSWLSEPKPDEVIVYAQLQARLMVNMAGGVMENAGLCLDRFGLPYIPGSAVKGCARRAALAALHEWCAAGGQPNHKPTGPDNPLAACCEPFTSPAHMLAAIARVFGWCELDWAGRSDQSDFRWACANDAASITAAAETLAAHFRWPIEDRHSQTPWLSLPNYAGSVSFLPAYPVDLGKTGKVDGLPLDVPTLGKLELDVVTCHHRDYYEGKLPVATDTEEPVPVVFPAVAPGHVFAFAVVPLRGADANLLKQARTWLKTGLETFGLGAKTNAGYGWFDASDTVQGTIRTALDQQARRLQSEQQQRAEEERRKAEEEEQRRKAEAIKAATKGMTPEQKADYEISQLTPEQFRGRLDNFTRRDPEEQKAIVRALRLPPDQQHSRRQFWDELKVKAQKGGKPAQIEQAIRQLSKQMFPGKEGKMP